MDLKAAAEQNARRPSSSPADARGQDTADILTLITRAFAAVCLSFIAITYARNADYLPTVLFGIIALIVWTLTFTLFRRILNRDPRRETPG